MDPDARKLLKTLTLELRRTLTSLNGTGCAAGMRIIAQRCLESRGLVPWLKLPPQSNTPPWDEAVSKFGRDFPTICESDQAPFASPEALGWAYQFWHEERKNRVFEQARSGRRAKIAGADLRAATQLYTESYMVRFLVQNSLGALWLAMAPHSPLAKQWEFLVRHADRALEPSRAVREITLLDPACGAGHFLLEAFDVFYDMYLDEGEVRSPQEICTSILRHNLYGIDIDPQAVRLAELALWMKAVERAPGIDCLPLNLVAADTRLPDDQHSVESFLHEYPKYRDQRQRLAGLFESLRHADELGTLLRIEGTRGVDRDAFECDLNVWFAKSAIRSGESEEVFGHRTEGGPTLFDLLGRRYDVVVANPPYLGTKHMGPVLRGYLKRHYHAARRDLYAAFMLRALELAKPGGRVAMVTQQSWLFLRTFAALRADPSVKPANGFRGMLRETSLEVLAHLGPRAFGEIGGEVVNAAMWVVLNAAPGENHHLVAMRLIAGDGPAEKRASLLAELKGATGTGRNHYRLRQALLESLPECPVVYWVGPEVLSILGQPLRVANLADVRQGLITSDNDRFVRTRWEVSAMGERWVPYAKAGGYARWRGFEWFVVDWEQQGGRIRATENPRVQNEAWYLKPGLTWSNVAFGKLGVRRHEAGTIHDAGSPTLFPRTEAAWGLAAILNSRLASYLVRLTSANSINLREGYIANLPVPPLAHLERFVGLAEACTVLKSALIADDLLEMTCNPHSNQSSYFLLETSNLDDLRLRQAAWLHTLEGYLDHEVCIAYGLDPAGAAVEAIHQETGTPAGWFPLLTGYDQFPEMPQEWPNLPEELRRHLAHHERSTLSADERTDLFSRLESHFSCGPKRGRSGRAAVRKADPDMQPQESGAYLPLPAETFLEELSEVMRLHPISVYWLVKEGVERQGWRCLPEERRKLEDCCTAALLERESPEPSAPFMNHALEERFTLIMGQSSERWMATRFFRHHTKQFKRRPIVWQLQSARPAAGQPVFFTFIHYHDLNEQSLPNLLREQSECLRGAMESDSPQLGELSRFMSGLRQVIEKGFGPDELQPQLKRYAKEDAVWSLAARWLARLAEAIRSGPLSGWQTMAAEAGLHDPPAWIGEAVESLTQVCTRALSFQPDELPDEPTVADLATVVVRQQASILVTASVWINDRWRRRLEELALTPLRAEIRMAKCRIKSLPSELRREEKQRIKRQEAELTTAVAAGKQLCKSIAEWAGPDTTDWQAWLAEQPMFDETSSWNGQTPPATIAEWIHDESRYAPDLHDGVRINIAPLQAAGLLAADVLPRADVVKAIADRARWRAEERRWIREGRLRRSC